MSDKLGLSAAGRKLVSDLKVPRDPAELAADGLTPDAIEALIGLGVLERQDNTRPPSDLYDAFSGWKSQRGMLADHVRTEAFQRAIQTVVKPGDRVIDVGTGSGVLAMFAAMAGAEESYGLEVTKMADWAARLAAANGLDAVRIVQGDAGSFAAPGQADVIMGEYIGYTFLDEWRHFTAFTQVRDRNLKPGGSVIPRAARLLVSAVDSRQLYFERGYGFWEAPAYGLDFSLVRASEVASPRRYIVTAQNNALVSTAEIASFDFLTATVEDYFFTSECVLPYAAAGSFHGVLAHFDLDLAPGEILATGPAARETCWHHSYLPLPQIQVPAGGEIKLRSRSFLDAESDTLCLGLTVAGPGQTLDEDLPEHVFALE